MSARGRLRCGSFTSPAMKPRSAQPSNAQSTDTSASPNARDRRSCPAGTAGVKWPPVFGSPSDERDDDDEQQPAVLRDRRHVLHERRPSERRRC